MFDAGPEQDVLPGATTVLVTGATGFIGRHLVARLEAAGKTVVGTSRSLGTDLARDPLPLEGIDHVIHVGARTGVVEAWADPVAFVETNTLGTLRLLEACRACKCAMTFISAYIYGVPQRLPIRESDPVDPNNPYALSKHLAEQACGFYARAYGLQVVTLRLFNVYGPGQALNFLIPFILEQLLDPARAEIEVMDLAPSRDYVFVDDVVDAVLLAAGAPTGSLFNVGSGTAHSVEDIIRQLIAVSGVDKPYKGKSMRRPNEIDTTVADIAALREAVGWQPRTSIEDGLRRVVEDQRQRR